MHCRVTVSQQPHNSALIAQLHLLKCDGLGLYVHVRTLMSDSDFEDFQQAARRPTVVQPVRVRDVDAAEIPRDADRQISESDLNADTQVFYFSKKLFEYISAGVSEERIQETGRRHAEHKQGVLVRRAEQKNRADKLRHFVEMKQLQKPSGDILRPSKKTRVSRPYTAFEQECKRFLVKWGNHPAILTQAKVLITDYDNALGDVSAYRTGRPSSKPTYQGSRRRSSK